VRHGVAGVREIRFSPAAKTSLDRIVLQHDGQAEICGLVGGETIGPGVVRATSVYPVKNQSRDSHSFAIDVGTFRRTTDSIRQGGDEPIAVYHTHPDGDVSPSLRDLELPEVTGLAILILARTAKGIQVAGYGFDGGVHPVAVRAAGG
jgi:proteasome lid subunit RPN8/RPN11